MTLPLVLVTGSTGFVGTGLTNRLAGEGKYRVRGAVRRGGASHPPYVEPVLVGDLSGATDWSVALEGVDTVIHLAARVHARRATLADDPDAFQRVNRTATEALGQAAARAGVRRFVFLSSIKVNGEWTLPGRPFSAHDAPGPADPYGQSKLDAETQLARIAGSSAMQVVIIRPPLVYGPGAKANFRTMMRWLHRGVPLPFGAIDNRRSLVALDNLTDLMATCVAHPHAANETFLVSDGEDLSTTELLARLGDALGRAARLIPVPSAVVRSCLTMIGRSDVAERLCASLQVDISHTRRTLAWNPPVSVEDGLRAAADAFQRERH